MTKKKILITGAHGTVGRYLARALLKHDVYLTDKGQGRELNYTRADVTNYRQLEQVIGNVEPDFVYHLAAEFGRVNGEQNYESLWNTNVVGTRNVLELQNMYDFKLIFASSSEVYGEGYGSEKLKEEIVWDKTPVQTNDYAISKWVNELQIRHMAERHQTKTMTLRFFNAYGPGEYYHPFRSVVCLFCYKALTGQPYTVYRNYHRAFMFMDDFIPTLANAPHNFQPGATINVGGLEVRTVEELDEIVWGLVPNMDRSKVTFLDAEALNVRDKRPDNTKAIATLGHGHKPFAPLEVGVAKTIGWMKREYDL